MITRGDVYSAIERNVFADVNGDIVFGSVEVATDAIMRLLSTEHPQPPAPQGVNGYNDALEWAASWITGPQMDGNGPDVVRFAKNMAMSIRAAKRKNHG